MVEEIKAEQFTDKFTRIDDLLARMIPTLEAIESRELTVKLPEPAEGDVTLKDIYNLLKEQRDASFEIFYLTYPNDGTLATFAVGTTILDFEHGTIKAPDGNVDKMSNSLSKMNKDYMRSVAINCNKDTVVQLDSNNKTPATADTWMKMTYQQFTVLRITTTVETKGYIHACTNPQAVHEMIGESSVSSSKIPIGIVPISTTSAIYAAEIAQNAYATENLLLHEAVDLFTIKHIAIWSEVALKYRLHFFANDDFNTTFDNATYIGYVDLDLVTYGAQIAGAGTYYMDVAGLNIDGVDGDASGEMHVALQNLSAATKQTTDKVMIDIYYEPRVAMVGM